MNRIQVWWFHFKMDNFGDALYDAHGGDIIPCKKCGTMFQSYPHFDTDWGDKTYDSLCEDCEFETIPHAHIKQQVERILSDYSSHVISWDSVKTYMAGEGFKIVTSQQCACMGCRLTGKEPSLRQIAREYPKESWQRELAHKLIRGAAHKGRDRLCALCFEHHRYGDEKC